MKTTFTVCRHHLLTISKYRKKNGNTRKDDGGAAWKSVVILMMRVTKAFPLAKDIQEEYIC